MIVTEPVNERLEKIFEISNGDSKMVETVEKFDKVCTEVEKIREFDLIGFLEKRNLDIEDDYNFTRDTFRELIKKGNEALDNIMKLAAEMESPRGYEVLAMLLKSVADTTKELLSLQKMAKELMSTEGNQNQFGNSDQSQVINNNAIFVGSTKELQEILKNNLKKKAEKAIEEIEEIEEDEEKIIGREKTNYCGECQEQDKQGTPQTDESEQQDFLL